MLADPTLDRSRHKNRSAATGVQGVGSNAFHTLNMQSIICAMNMSDYTKAWREPLPAKFGPGKFLKVTPERREGLR